MGRRALSIAAIVLWLGAGLAFGLFGLRAIRLERASASDDARRRAEAAVQAGVLYLPTAVSEAISGTTFRIRILDAQAGTASNSASAIPPEDAFLLSQAAYLERAGQALQALELLARMTAPVQRSLTTAVASLRAGALTLASGAETDAASLLETAAGSPLSWRDPDGIPIAPAAWRLLATIEARAGKAESLSRLLDAADDGNVVRLDGSIDLPDLLLATAYDLDPARDRLPDAIVDRLDVAEVRAAEGQRTVRAMGNRGVAVVEGRDHQMATVAVRTVDDPSSITARSMLFVQHAIVRRTGIPLRLTGGPSATAPWKRGEAPLEAVYVSYPDWEQSIAKPVGIVALSIGLALYLVAGGLAILWLRRSAKTARMQADFVAAVSHEMKTPIAGIQAMAEMLADGRVPDPARAHAYAERIRAEAARLGAGVRNVLDAARIERDPSSIVHPVPVEPSVLVEDLASVMRPVFEGRGFRFTVKTTPSPRPIPIDPDSFGSVVGNLLDNAAKFSTETKEIDVEARPVANGYRVAVSDRGPGVPRDERAKIFDRFQRGEHARRMAVPGVGLGLHVARNLMKAHGGSISVTDRGGGGAVFVVEWPGATS